MVSPQELQYTTAVFGLLLFVWLLIDHDDWPDGNA